MGAVSALALGEAAIAAIAVLLTAYEAWLFRLRGRREHLWAALGAVAMAVYSGAMLFHYDASPEDAVFLSRVEAAVFVIVGHCAPLFVASLPVRRFPIPTPALLASMGLWMMLIPWLVPAQIVEQPMLLLDHPFPRHSGSLVYVIGVGYALTLAALSVYWAARHTEPEDEHTWGFFTVGIAAWALGGAHDAIAPMLGLPFALNLFEYGFCAFGLVIVSHDASRYMRMLAASEQDSRKLIDNSPEAIFITCEGEIVYANKAASDLVGVTASELRNRLFESVVHDDDAGRLTTMLEREGAGSMDLRLIGDDGQPVHTELFTTHTSWDGRSAVVSLARDVTGRRALTAQMMEADRLISVGTVAAAAGHEINNPLAYVILHLEAAQEDLVRQSAAGADIAESLRRVESALGGTRRIADLVRAIGFFSRPHEGESVFDVGAVIESAAAIASNEARHRARLTEEVEIGLYVRGNPTKLGQVFVNLLVNAAQALEEGAADENEITVRAFTLGDRIICEVSDTGPGIPNEIVEQIFEPFFTTKPAGSGSGIGLGIARETVRALGGEMSVDGGYGEGATFRVELPRAEEPSRRVSKVPSVRPPRRARLLLVDDEPELLRALTRALRRDAEITVAHSAAEAIEVLESGETFDLVLSDLMMPDGTGMELHGRIARDWPDLSRHMVFMTGGAFSPGARAFRDEVDNEIIDKPIDLEHVREILRDATGSGGHSP